MPPRFASRRRRLQYIADTPVVAHGRVELLWYVREQSISHVYHRYGNLGLRRRTHATNRCNFMRIVSLLPSATEIVCQLGLDSELVGVTHECDYPPSVRALPKVTRTLIPPAASSREIDDLVRERLKTERALYTLDLPMLDRVAARSDRDAGALRRVRSGRGRGARRGMLAPGQPQVINLEPTCLDDVFECLRLVGDATGRNERGADKKSPNCKPRSRPSPERK